MNGAHEIRRHLLFDKVERHILDRTHSRETGVVHQNINPPEVTDGRRNNILRLACIGYIEPPREQLVGKAGCKIIQRAWSSRGCNHVMAGGERGLNDRTTQAD